jgi:hypothetical protein
MGHARRPHRSGRADSGSRAQAASTSAQAAATGAAPVRNPYSPAYHHSYRHGVIPTIKVEAKMHRWAHNHPGIAALSANDLNYGGGIDGIGVTTGQEKVYLVFYGSQWGTQGTNGSGNVTLSGDPSGEAPYVQQLHRGLGTAGELWSGVMTQYCDGVAAGSQSCPASNTKHVAYPTGGALAGVWVDESTASPAQASGHQLGVEAVSAAAHFGNTTAASNRDAQYVILSLTGTDPDGWLTNGFCAWHDYNGDSTLSGGPVTSPYGDIAFTNLPYITDAGASCGQDFVNSNGTLDGVSIVEGHEYAETVTDQNPAGVLANTSMGVPAHSGSWLAWLDGYGARHTDTLAQTVTIPASCKNATLSFWLDMSTNDPTNAASDTFTVQVLNSSGTVLATLATLSNQNATGGYSQHSYSVAPYIGQKITIKYTGNETLSGHDTSFFEDDNALNVS